MKYFLTAILLLLTVAAEAQTQNTAEESLFRQSGKIYVVIAVIGLIFAGIVAYLIRLDFKLKQLENQKKVS